MQIYFQRIPFTLLLNTVVKCSFFDYILVENIFFFFSAQYVYLWRIFIRVQLAQRLKYKDSLLFHVVERCRKKQTRIKQAKGEQFQLNRTFSFASGDNNASFEKKKQHKASCAYLYLRICIKNDLYLRNTQNHILFVLGLDASYLVNICPNGEIVQCQR